MRRSSDADRLRAIQDLGRAISAKQPELSAARARRDADARLVQERERAVRQVDQQIAGLHATRHRTESSVYLNGKALDRGTLRLGNYAVDFSGWRGSVSAPLASIVSVELGSSNLPSRAGIPIIGRFRPGKPRARRTVIATVTGPGGTGARLMVLADLENGSDWATAIADRQARLGDVAAQQSELVARRAEAGGLVAGAAERRNISQADLRAVEQGIAVLRGQKSKLEDQQRQLDAARRKQVEQVRTVGKQKVKRQ